MRTRFTRSFAAGAIVLLGPLVAAASLLGPQSSSGTAEKAALDPLVTSMIGEVSVKRLRSDVEALTDFGTRHTSTQGNADAVSWLHDRFQTLGLEVERHVFSFGNGTSVNVIARIPGKTLPAEIVAISAHLDSTSQRPQSDAPGADDDASGIAGVLEAARVFKQHQFERTIEFMCFNAEEQGRQGSNAIARDYRRDGKQLVAVLNSDMIGYWPTGWERDLDVAFEPVSRWLAEHVISACERYVGIPVRRHRSQACRDDHISFTTRNIPAVTNMDCWEAHNGGDETTPHYHRSSDTADTLDFERLAQVARVNVAAVAELAGPLLLDAGLSSARERIELTLTAGADRGLLPYVVLGSVSGTQPGLPLPGGSILPIAPDVFTRATLATSGSASFTGFSGLLDARGRATAACPLPAGILGATGELDFHFACVIGTSLELCTDSVRVEIRP